MLSLWNAARGVALGLLMLTTQMSSIEAKTLFRVDSRPPASVFTEGLKPFGSNDQLLFHLSGATVGPQGYDSAFTSLASTEEQAKRIAALRFFNSPGRFSEKLYIYEISSSAATYSVDRFVSAAVYQGDQHVRRLALVARSELLSTGDYVAVGKIPAKNIVKATPYTYSVAQNSWMQGALVPDPNILNPSYDAQSEVEPSDFSYPMQGAGPLFLLPAGPYNVYVAQTAMHTFPFYYCRDQSVQTPELIPWQLGQKQLFAAGQTSTPDASAPLSNSAYIDYMASGAWTAPIITQTAPTASYSIPGVLFTGCTSARTISAGKLISRLPQSHYSTLILLAK